MKLYVIYFTYGEHEPEHAHFVWPYISTDPENEDAEQFLLREYGGDEEYMSNPELLLIEGIYPVDEFSDQNGNVYGVEITSNV